MGQYEAGAISAEVSEGLGLLKAAADRGHVLACKTLGMRLDPKFVPAGFRKPVEYLHVAAESGDGAAQRALGSALVVAGGLSAGRAWLVRAAQGGNFDAMVALAQSYEEPQTEPSNEAEAYRWFLKAAELGQEDAMKAVARRLEAGRGVPKDIRAAMAWYKREAGPFNAYSAIRLAELYQSGPPEVRDQAEAFRWAMTYIVWDVEGGDGTLYFDGHPGLGVMEPYVLKYDNLANARLALGLMLETGDGLARDPAGALEWYHRATFFLGDRYKDLWTLAWFKCATMMELGAGEILAWNRGEDEGPSQVLTRDPLVAYREAENLVIRLTGDHLAFLRDASSEADGTLKKVLPDLRAAADRGVAQANHDLGVLHLYGRGVSKDEHLALKFLALAAESGHLPSICRLGRMYDHAVGRGEELADLHVPPDPAKSLAYRREEARIVSSRIKGKTRFDGWLSEPVPADASYGRFRKALTGPEFKRDRPRSRTLLQEIFIEQER